MGIQGLIPFLEKSSRPTNISQFSGCTVAIDAYCWLHKGAFSCADKLAKGEKTYAYVTYCMKYVNMLLSHNIEPILVFDGRHLPAKSETEKKRRQNREVNKRRAAELLRQDKPNEARTFLQRCVDVTHTMAVDLMRECRSLNVDCITAPYEADAQLAYLNITNIAHIVITEDSDLLLFGCTKVMFKLDLNGNGLLVDQDNLYKSMGVSKGCFSLDKFRQMCILSGCDYLPSLPKVGLVKACRFIKSTVDPDIHRALSRLGGHLNMNIVVPLEYRDKFVQAEAMFRHQPVFDPLSRRLVPLTPATPGSMPPPLLSEEPLSNDQLLQLMLGNLDPFTLETVDNWNPDVPQEKFKQQKGWAGKQICRHKSIWSVDFKPKPIVFEKPDVCKIQRFSTSGKVIEKEVEVPKLSTKRPILSAEEELNALRLQFGKMPDSNPNKKARLSADEIFERLDSLDKCDETPTKSEADNTHLLQSPTKAQVNPFTKATPTSSKKFSGLSKLAQFRKSTGSESVSNTVQSRYFNNFSKVESSNKPNDDHKVENDSLTEVSNLIEHKPKNETIKKLDDSTITEVLKEDENIKTERKELGKENSPIAVPVKSEKTFKWRQSLSDIYGFKSKNISSSAAVKKDFVNPKKDELHIKDKTCIDDSQPVKQTKTVSKNPFAKVSTLKTVETPQTQESSEQSEVLTPDSAFSEDSNISTSPVKTTLKPQMNIGLSKKQSTGCQKSLLSMFAFTPKPKLKH